MEDIQALGMQLEAMQGQLQQAEDGWKAARQDVEALQEQTDGLERERNKLADQVAALQAELEATQKVGSARCVLHSHVLEPDSAPTEARE